MCSTVLFQHVQGWWIYSQYKNIVKTFFIRDCLDSYIIIVIRRGPVMETWLTVNPQLLRPDIVIHHVHLHDHSVYESR